MDSRIPRSIGSTLLLFGAFAIGGGLHQTFVKGTLEPTSLPFVLSIVVGSGLVYAGWRLEEAFDPSEMVPDEEAEEDDDEAAFDESMSPLDETDLEGHERDDSYDG